MSRRIVTVSVALVALMTMVLSGVGNAHVFTADTSIEIHKSPDHPTDPGTQVLIFGTVHSSHDLCRINRVIKLFEVVSKGPDILIKSTTTDGDGNWGVTFNPSGDLQVYAKVRRLHQHSYGHDHTCLKSRSQNKTIDADFT